MNGISNESKVDSAVTKKLCEIVGEKNATDYKHIRYAYSYDLSFVKPKLPDYVVMPTNVEQVQKVMKFANQEKISVTPFTAGTNIGGLCIPENGGILLDMKRMNQIIRIDEESHYAIIEPGVSHAKFASALAKYNLRWSWPVGPPSASTSSCAISHGIGGLSARYGLNSEEITSMEVVLPTGELVRVGSCAIQEDAWHSCLPLPRMDGLFTGWLGTTGVITKLGVRVHPTPPILKVFTASTENIGQMASYLRTLGNYEICDDLTGVSWWLSNVPIPYPYKPKPADVPEWISFATTFSWTEKEKQAREEIWKMVVDEETKKGSSLKETEYPEEALRARTQLPSQIVGSTKNYTKQGGAGISWPGTFTPVNKWEPVYEAWKKILIGRNLSPSVRVTNYRGVHYGMLRAMIPFPKKDPASIENARQAIVECLKVDLDNGGIPYKPPVDFGVEINKRAHPGYVDLLKRVKNMLDPNDIMNTGKLAL
ncbi:MAG: FAD-binding oxidoreductase [Desulfobacula sp.]|jgi:glycolate oxidase|uniref:FAD-binding oxidoreductase n=1 Tax=Desulfobacula sp. TaxID=2593537 RepID=UPI001D2B817A|nr:FAD-binding oxidoreductase [Desulfobacula sp.]MBT3484173.1 FAD-binding oxidoreductase [Desulfobacula sp.]MBT3803713.1 FAD-binding oxidoreductase [Desulfobacula sp.]MBT4024418.1 FAD-binding oxidoreductase [Desulfobacula sp.]MBT4198459.1 FAD-binding oxidoreductase [Desulfobacula sp.]